MVDLPAPTLRLEFDGAALADNWRALDRLSGTAQAGAAIKAKCYGLGVDRCAPILRDAGARKFYVAHWSEVPPLLKHVPADQVAVLHGPVTSHEAEFACATHVRPVINSIHQAKIWTEAGGGVCDLMVDTGINRLGIAPEEIGDDAIGSLQIDTLMSHLACADEDSAMNREQLNSFEQVSATVGSGQLSMANSAGIVLGPDYHFDQTRPGISLYGGVPRPELAGVIRQVAFPQAAIIQMRCLNAGDRVGYNATFTADRQMRVGVVSLGYADGFLLSRGPGGVLHYRGHSLPLLGKVSMDMVVVDLTDIPQCREGDWLDVPFDLPRAAKASGLSQYELLTTLGARFGA